MRRIVMAFRLFFATLFGRADMQRAQELLAPKKEVSQRAETPRDVTVGVRAAKRPERSEAITLLAALQREARFLDLVQEPLDQFTDQQIGAAAREVLRNCARTLQRMFDLQPLIDQPEGSAIEMPADADASRYHLVGNVTGQPPYAGALIHPGWRAQNCRLPEWTGSDTSIWVISPAEIELK